MKVYLLAAGYATRLYPLTRDRPKALLEIGDRPLLSHILDRVLELEGLSEIVLIANHRFVEPLSAWADSVPSSITVLDDGSNSDDDKLGAIGDLAFGLRESPTEPDEDFVVIASDNWLGFDLRPAQADYREQGRRAMLLLRDLGAVPEGPSPYNEVTTDPDGRVLRFREKPQNPQTQLAAIAVYFFPTRVAEQIHYYLEQGGNPDAPGHFVEWLVQHAPVWSHLFDGEWMDIGTAEALETARERFPRK